MAASPADAPLARIFGGAILRHDRLAGPASHDGEGGRFVFLPPSGAAHAFAIDVEPRHRPAPPALAAALGRDAMARWGEIEVMAKLTGLPAHLVLRRVLAGGGAALAAGYGLEIARADTPGHWVVAGRRAP